MATEIEMKLTVPSHEVMDEILRDPQLTDYMLDEIVTRRMRSTYYDTESGTLRTRRWMLRLRDEDGDDVVALKTPNIHNAEGLFTRGEWQCHAARPEMAIDRLVDAGAPPVLRDLLQGRPLLPTCRADFIRRSTCLYLPDGVRIEIAADEGTLSGGGREMPICELELELLFGDSDALLPICNRLEDAYGLTRERLSKFQRAIALAEEPA